MLGKQSTDWAHLQPLRKFCGKDNAWARNLLYSTRKSPPFLLIRAKRQESLIHLLGITLRDKSWTVSLSRCLICF